MIQLTHTHTFQVQHCRKFYQDDTSCVSLLRSQSSDFFCYIFLLWYCCSMARLRQHKCHLYAERAHISTFHMTHIWQLATHGCFEFKIFKLGLQVSKIRPDSGNFLSFIHPPPPLKKKICNNTFILLKKKIYKKMHQRPKQIENEVSDLWHWLHWLQVCIL